MIQLDSNPAIRIFVHVKMQVLVQSQRFMVFTIVDTLVARHREGKSAFNTSNLRLIKLRAALKIMGKEFLSGYIALADGEKDPRNLLLAFSIARVLLIEFEVSGHIEVRDFSM